MKLYLHLLLFFTGLLITSSSNGQSWLWAKQPVYTGHPTDQSDGEVYGIATDNAGNVYETGFFAYATMQYGTFALNSVNPTAFLVKYDANGNPQWATQGVLKTEYDESIANAVAVDSAGNIYITGFFMDSVTFGNITLTTNPGQQQEDFLEVFLVKYNSIGIVQWARQSTTAQFNGYPTQGLGVTCDHAGNIYVTGQFGNTITFGTASVTTPTGGAGDVFLVKYDTNGNVIWAEGGRLPSNIGSARGNAVTVDANDNVYITGSFHDTLSFGATTLINKSVVGDIFIAKFTSDAVPLWAVQTTNRSTDFWENGPISGNGIVTDRAGNVYLSGNFEDTIYFGSIELTTPINFAQYAFPYGDMVIAKYDPNGNVVWAQAAQPFTNGSYAGWSIACDSSNHLYYLGTAANFYSGAQANYTIKFGADTFSTGDNPASWEGSFVIEFDTSGNVLCGNAMPMGGDDQGGITTNLSGEYVYMGQDYNAQTTVYIAGDTINYPAVTGEEIPFVTRWSPCVKASPLQLSTNQTNVTCNGLCNGRATANPSGGTAPYKYLWNTPHSDTTQTVTGLCANTYTVVVTDNAGATASSAVTITEPAVFKVSASPDTSICKGDTVILNAATSGGTGPFTYAWSPNTGLNNTTNSQVTVSPSDSTIYSVIATDTGSCTASATVSVNINTVLPPDMVVADSLICSGDSTQVCAQGIYSSYLWNTSATTSCVEANSGGGYWATVTDANGCSVISSHANISVYPASPFSIVVQNDTLSSYGAVAYQWYLNDSAIAGATSPLLVARVAGSYTVQITDTNGCQATSNPVAITGVSNLKPDNVNVYPNPSTGSWLLTTGNEWIGSQLTLYSTDGRIVLSSIVRSTTTAISFNAMSGVYLLQLSSPTACFTYKLIRL